MANNERPHFSSVEQELSHFRELATKYKESYESVKEELEDFQASSQELEVELEAQLNQTENKNRELKSLNSRLQADVENLQEKLLKLQSVSEKQTSDLETQLVEAKAYVERMQAYIQRLEQTNDDLERAQRATVVSLEDFEVRLNQAIERNAFLESELDEKENLVVNVQRLKDEARDLRHELAVHNKPDSVVKSDKETEKMDMEIQRNDKLPNAGQDILQGTPFGDSIDPGKVETMSKKPEPITPAKTGNQQNFEDIMRQRTDSSTPSRNNSFLMASPINASTRISALNIVSDLLRKVGALESKLNSCRSTTCNQPQLGQRNRDRNSPGSPSNSPSSKRASTGTGLPMSSSSVGKGGYVQITV